MSLFGEGFPAKSQPKAQTTTPIDKDTTSLSSSNEGDTQSSTNLCPKHIFVALEFFLQAKNNLKGILTSNYSHVEFNSFYKEIAEHFKKEYNVVDDDLFKSLMHTFYIVAN